MKSRFPALAIPGLLALAISVVALPASADNQRQFKIRLKGFEEVPSVSTVATGELELTVNNAGTEVDYVLSWTGLQGKVTQAHIHVAQRSVNGGIVVWLCKTADVRPTDPVVAGLTPDCPLSSSGTVSGTFTAANVLAAQPAQQIVAGELAEVIAAMRAGVAYGNVHTDLSPGGEIRGQIGDRIFNFLHHLFH